MGTRQVQTYENGVLVSTRTDQIPDEYINAETMMNKLAIALTKLETAEENWATLTAAEKDTATRNCILATAKLCRFLLQRLEAS